jgi:uncharacterized membrane protein
MMAKEDVIELNMSVDEALKYIISMGVVSPKSVAPKSALTTKAPEPEKRVGKRVAKPVVKPRTKISSNP